VSLTVTPRHNNIGSAQLVVPSDHRRLPLLLADGARLVIDYRGERLMSGYIRNPFGDFGPDGTMTFPVQDDLWMLERMLGWPVPTAAISAQGAKAQDTRTGPLRPSPRATCPASSLTTRSTRSPSLPTSGAAPRSPPCRRGCSNSPRCC
jgi:hypothetical protein